MLKDSSASKTVSYLILGDSVPVQKSELQLQVCQPIVCSREVKHK